MITTEKLGDASGPRSRASTGTACCTTTTSPPACLEALEANGALVFRDLHIDDATQVAFSRKLGEVEVFGKGEHPEIFRVTLDPAKNPVGRLPARHLRLAHRRLHRRHPDHGHHAQRPRGGRDGRRDRVRQHLRRLRRPRRRGEGAVRVGAGRAHHRGLPAPGLRRPEPEEVAIVAQAAGQGAPARVAAPLGPPLARARRHHRPRGGHGPRRGPGAARRPAGPLDHPRPGLPPRVERGRRGHLGQPGVLHRACPYDPTSPRDMHRTTFAGDEPIQ